MIAAKTLFKRFIETVVQLAVMAVLNKVVQCNSRRT